MSIELVLYPKKATKEKLRSLLISLGCFKTGHLWPWPEGSIHYAWYEDTDFQSTDGVETTVFPLDEDRRRQFKAAPWALHTRTRASASSFDRAKQNEIIRAARRAFGGTFTNDWYGTNHYTPTEHDPRTPAGRGIAAAYAFAEQQIKSVQFALPKPLSDPPAGAPDAVLARYDPTRVLYNALVPFAVAILEYFFSQTFKVLLRYDQRAQAKLREQQRRVDVADLLAVAAQERRVEDVVASWYSFQSIASIHAAYKDWFNIDLRRLLRRRRKIGRQIRFLDDQLERIIQLRHGVVHRLELDLDISRDQIDAILEAALLLMQTMILFLERDSGIQIQDDWTRISFERRGLNAAPFARN